jgi:hypothetical protein
VQRLTLALVAALTLVACGDDDDGASPATTQATSSTSSMPSVTPVDPSGAPRDPSDPLCVAAEEVRAADIDYQVRLGEAVQVALEAQDVTPLNEALTEVDEDGTLANLLGAYERLSAEVPPEQQQNVALLRAFTEEFFRGMNGLPNFGEIRAYLDALETDPDAQAANDAGVALDAYVRGECGAGITASG